MTSIIRLGSIVNERAVAAPQPHPYESLVTRVFHHNSAITPEQYIGAANDPRIARFGLLRPHLRSDSKIDFSRRATLGNNEKTLFSTIVDAEHAIVGIVGPMGSGKSTFLHLLSTLFPTICVNSQSPFNTWPPIIRLVDLAQTKLVTISYTDEDRIKDDCVDVLISKLEAILFDNGISVDHEITEVWDDFLAPTSAALTNDARDDVVRRVRSAGLESPVGTTREAHAAFLSARRAVRATIAEDPDRHLKYLIAVLSSIRRKRYPMFRPGIVIALDNLDPLPPVVLRVLRHLITTHMNHCDFRVLVTMRVSTHRMQVVNQWQHMVDHVPHNGPSPVEVVASRLADLETELDQLGLDTHVRSLVKTLRSNLRDQRHPFYQFLSTMSGWSIRRALVMAQMPFVSPFTISGRSGASDFSAHTLIRAMICGYDGRFEWSPLKEIDNVFAVHNVKGSHCLVKLRLLTAIATLEPTRSPEISELVEIGLAFNYREDVVRIALNEMMCAPKRLIWTDTLLEFPTVEVFNAARRSKVYLSRTGAGYLKAIEELTYVQEMMLDTFVEAEDWPDDLPFERPVDRGFAVVRFLRMLLQRDRFEIQQFLKCADWKRYEDYFGQKQLLGSCVPACTRAIMAIATSKESVARLPAVAEELERLRLECIDIETLASLRPWDAADALRDGPKTSRGKS